jgi:hypothetical protein
MYLWTNKILNEVKMGLEKSIREIRETMEKGESDEDVLSDVIVVIADAKGQIEDILNNE